MPPLNSKRDHLSLPEVHGTIRTGQTTVLRRMLAFAGPGFLVAVGYMDPGNWATAIAGGSAFGYTLLSVVLLSNIMAVLLQALAVRMGIAGGRDLAQFCYEQFGKPARIFLWLMAETAIIATDLAEVIGTAIALNLLFNMPALGRSPYSARRLPDPLAARQRFPQIRGSGHHSHPRDYGLFHR